ncbi:DNA-binding transcriptional MerR regulator [Paenibacillus castaneae]|uniref:MerR family transcriptional regulator n=1 Tax=Paenibacillus castaneae TaxID=474957 RepID=UPI000C9A5F82|nr:MerR family transcriptional regulator [Paenibacillus castaneae]NIK77868.1 DNA-binding transcriptional MerR regulator [Paenibacillus castaneae]
MMMTIQAFALQTGLPATTLRYYENKKLLVPDMRGGNGYRYYSDDQIPIARLIQSFRHSAVPINDIRQFLGSSLEDQEKLLERWRQEVEENLKSLQVAKQYLTGMKPGQKTVQMVKWEDQTIMVWFSHVLPYSQLPFEQPIALNMKRLAAANMDIVPGSYIRLLSAYGNTLEVEIGYHLTAKAVRFDQLQLPSDWNARLELLNPTMFVTIEARKRDKFMCMQYSRILNKHGFDPIGPRWDRYDTENEDHFLVYIPVVQKGIDLN